MGFPMPRRVVALATIVIAMFVSTSTASAAQTQTVSGVTVTMSVTPSDIGPGHKATIKFTRVAPAGGTFSWSTCLCKLKIAKGTKVLVNRTAASSNAYTFPSTGAYKVTLSGRYKKKGKWIAFASTFTQRIDATDCTHALRSARCHLG